MNEGKMQPQAVELEEAVLGAMMLEIDCFETVSDILNDDCFYKPAHKLIFKAVTSLKIKNEAIDLLTITNELKRTKELDLVGGAYYISQLTNRVASTANVENHARIIMQKHLSRELIKINNDFLNKAYDEEIDVFELIDSQENKLKVLANLTTSDAVLIQEVAQENIKHIREIKSGKIIQGVYAGFESIQEKLGGWKNTNLIIVAGRPAMGKTALGFQFALNPAIEYNTPTAFFSLEMSKNELTNRALSIISGFSTTNIMNANMNTQQVDSLELSSNSLFGVPIYIDDTAALSIPDFKRKARRLTIDKGVKLIVIDYLQLMTTGDKSNKGNREQEISFISRSLKATAKDLNIPIIALSQLSRQVESRSDKRPIVSDLRESGAIEQDADMIIFPFRPEYYGIKEFEDGLDATGKAEIIVAKNRNGALIAPILNYTGHQTMFSDLGEKNKSDNYTPPLTPNTSFIEQDKF